MWLLGRYFKNKKMNSNSMLSIACAIQFFSVACNSPEPMTELPLEKVSPVGHEEMDSGVHANNELKKLEPIESLLTEQITDSWTHFKLETGKHLDKNDTDILKIKQVVGLNVASLKKALSLEEKNAELRMKLNEFDNSDKVSQQRFKVSMQEDLDLLDADIEWLRINRAIEI